MSQHVRLLLKAVALGRYLLSNQRLSKLAIGAKGAVNGNTTVKDVAKTMLPLSKGALKDHLKSTRFKRHMKFYLAGLVTIGIVAYEYNQHQSFVPITQRKHFVIIPRDVELSYQETIVHMLETQFAKEGQHILPTSDPRYIYITSILHQLIESCIYFSPECENYMRHLRVVVVDDDTVNAYTNMGSIIVIYTGLLDHFEAQKKAGENIDVTECIAGVLAHELSHSLSRHPVESMLRWTGWAYYIYITLIPDLVFMPLLKGIFDKKSSRTQEFEADFQALYLLKRSGYDPSSFIKTLSLLPEDKEDIELVSIAKESMDDHPRIINRVSHLQDRIFWFEKDFQRRYEIVKELNTESTSLISSILNYIRFGY